MHLTKVTWSQFLLHGQKYCFVHFWFLVHLSLKGLRVTHWTEARSWDRSELPQRIYLFPQITLYVRMVLAADAFSHLKLQEPNCGFCITSSITCREGVVVNLVFPVGLATQIHCAGLCTRYKSYCKVLDLWNDITLAYPNGHSPLSLSLDTRHSEYSPGQGRSTLTNVLPLARRLGEVLPFPQEALALCYFTGWIFSIETRTEFSTGLTTPEAPGQWNAW